jgi:hypothetical protein
LASCNVQIACIHAPQASYPASDMAAEGGV